MSARTSRGDAAQRRHAHPRRLMAIVALLAMSLGACVFGGGDENADLTFTATVLRSANLFVGSEVRVLGLVVGTVSDITPTGDTVEVEMTVDGERQYPADVNVRLTPISLLGERFVALDPPYTGGPTLQDGAVVPLQRTGIPAEVDEVLRSFEDFLSALDSGALAELIDALSDTLDGNGQGLNDLVANGAETVRVLSDSSVDLNQLVRDLATLNETLATREATIGSTLTNASTVLRNLQEDRDLLIGALNELQRSLNELAPIIDEQGDPLVRDLEILATTLSTVDRNLARLGDAFFGARRLFEGTGRIIEYEDARLPLDNEAGNLGVAVQERVGDRLEGLCRRLEVDDCSPITDLIDQLPDLCIPPVCTPGGTELTLSEALGLALSELPLEQREQLAIELEQRVAEPAAQPAAPAGAQPEPAEDSRGSGLPAPDPTLEGRDSVPEAPVAPRLPGEDDPEAEEQ